MPETRHVRCKGPATRFVTWGLLAWCVSKCSAPTIGVMSGSRLGHGGGLGLMVRTMGLARPGDEWATAMSSSSLALLLHQSRSAANWVAPARVSYAQDVARRLARQ